MLESIKFRPEILHAIPDIFTLEESDLLTQILESSRT